MNTPKTKGWVMLFIWAILIAAGIVTKRVFGHPDWMTFFHLPAAVFLVMAFRILSKDFRMEYQRRMLERLSSRGKLKGTGAQT